jgi:hypothetical protein
VRGREEDAAHVRQQQLLLLEVGDAEHQDVVAPLAGRRIHRVRAPAAVEQESLAVDEVRRSPVVRQLLRHLRESQCELVEVCHRRHERSLKIS